MSQISGGTTANLHGQSFEKHIITQLESKGLETITSKEFDKVLQLSNFKEKLNELYPNGVIATGRNYYKRYMAIQTVLTNIGYLKTESFTDLSVNGSKNQVVSMKLFLIFI